MPPIKGPRGIMYTTKQKVEEFKTLEKHSNINTDLDDQTHTTE